MNDVLFYIKQYAVPWLGNLWLASVGIPQGGHCSGAIMCCYFIECERQFIVHHTENKNGNKKVAEAFSITRRKLDDVLSLNNPYFKEYILATEGIAGVYPSKYFSIEFGKTDYLQLTISIIKNVSKAKSVDFLSMNQAELRTFAREHHIPIHGRENVSEFRKRVASFFPAQSHKELLWNTTTYHKTDGFPIHVASFLMWFSASHEKAMIGYITGAITSIHRENLLLYRDFLENITQLFIRLHNFNHFPRGVLIRTLLRYLSRFKKMYSRAISYIIAMFFKSYASRIPVPVTHTQ